jgi:hypothetical protein
MADAIVGQFLKGMGAIQASTAEVKAEEKRA